MGFLTHSVFLGTATFAALLGAILAGHRIGRWRLLSDGANPGHDAGHGVIEGAVFALLGLLLAFSFSGAAGRFADRRDLITQEANAMGTAWLRVDLLPAASQPAVRAAFRAYVDARLAVYRDPADAAAVAAAQRAVSGAQGALWGRVVAVVTTPEGQSALNAVVPAMNEMFDVATTRTMAMEVHQPVLLYGILVLLMLIASFVSGVSMAPSDRASRVHALVLAATLALTLWLTLDMEFPRRGVLRITSYDKVLTDLRATMDRGG